MEKINVLIVEDEPFVAKSIESILVGLGYSIAGVFSSGKETLKFFDPTLVDVIIMDIQLKGEMNGVETAMAIYKMSTTPIIYLTDNHNESLRKQAIFKTNSVQYLTKPFTSLDIDIAIDMALKTIRKNEFHDSQTDQSAYLEGDCIFVRENDTFQKLPIGHIVMLEADGAYCKLFYKDNRSNTKEMLFSENMSILEGKLAFTKDLYRIHRSYIINVKFLTKIQESRLWIEERELPIGKTYRQQFKTRFRFI